MSYSTIIVLTMVSLASMLVCVISLIFAGNNTERKRRFLLVRLAAMAYIVSMCVAIGGLISARGDKMDTNDLAVTVGFLGAIMLVVLAISSMVILSDSPKH